MFLRFTARPSSYKFIVTDRTSEPQGTDSRLSLTLKQTSLLTGSRCTIEGNRDAFRLPIDLTVEPGDPYGPINPDNFRIKDFQNGSLESWQDETPLHHLGVIHFSPKLPEFSLPDCIELNARMREQSFAKIWDLLKSGKTIDTVIINAFGSALRVEIGHNAYNWGWLQTTESNYLLCASLTFVIPGCLPEDEDT